MKDRLQIYVIYFLSWFKMKKITLIFFTLCGICAAHAQTSPAVDSGMVSQKIQVISQPGKNDQVVAKETPLVRVFPNPAKNKVELDIKGFEPGYMQIILQNNSGKKVREEKRLIFNGNETIVLMFLEKPGIYFLLLRQGTKSLRTKLVIQ